MAGWMDTPLPPIGGKRRPFLSFGKLSRMAARYPYVRRLINERMQMMGLDPLPPLVAPKPEPAG